MKKALNFKKNAKIWFIALKIITRNEFKFEKNHSNNILITKSLKLMQEFPRN